MIKKRRLKLPAALILSLMLILMFCPVPVSAASSDGASGASDTVKTIFSVHKGKHKVVITDIEYDRSDREVEFEFKNPVKYKNVKVKITRNGKNYTKKISEKECRSLEVKVKKLTYGKTYHYKITGIKDKKGKKYETIKGTFKAVDD